MEDKMKVGSIILTSIIFFLLVSPSISSLHSFDSQNEFKRLVIESKELNLFFDEKPKMNNERWSDDFNGLFTVSQPDLVFLTLESWWGPINTSERGLFVRYRVLNRGATHNSSDVIESNLTFYEENNQSSFGFIIQTPLFYPRQWFTGEILGGCHFFDIETKPQSIRVVIDANQTIDESNELNNEQIITVKDGIVIDGTIYQQHNHSLIPCSEYIEVKQCNESSLNDFEYRTFRTDEQGQYRLSINPKAEVNTSMRYCILAKNNDDTNMQMSSKLKEGETCRVDFIFEGFKPRKPFSPFGFHFGFLNKSYKYLCVTKDVDQDQIFYKMDWGDGTYSSWIGPFESKQKYVFSHRWNTSGDYSLRVICKDETGLLSEWSEPMKCTIINKERNIEKIEWLINFLFPFFLFVNSLGCMYDFAGVI